MAREVGAEATEGTMPPPRGGEYRASAGNLTSPFGASFGHPHLMVNMLGERFVDEEVTVTTPFGANAIALQKDRCAVRIYDEDTKDYFIQYGLAFPMGFGIAQAGTPTTTVDRAEFEAEVDRILNGGSNMIFVAESIAELAMNAGIDPEALTKTVEEYNTCCDTGRDYLFNKKARYLRPVRRPKFYAARTLAGTGTPEGIKINYKTEVLTKDFAVIPGLYAAGMDVACNLYKDIYPNVLPGNAMGFSLGTGRIAAENAVEYVKALG
jgi:fumarate reductase flavoprotein subunit